MSDVPEGYKVSEVGVIPEDWKVKELGEIGDLTSSKRIFESEYVSNGIPFYRGKEISMLINNEPITDELYITEEKYNKIKKIFGVPKKGDILITAVGTLGNVYSIPNERRFYFKDGNLIWIKDIHSADSKFFAYQIGQKKNEIYNNAIGSSQKALTIVVLKKIQIPLPPTIEEEQAIATALSDVDALITAQEQLITKKRNIKQGAMQQLLTGEKRLPGFGGAWEVKKLGDIASGVASGKSKSKSGVGTYPIYGSTGIIGSYNFYDYEGKKILIARVGANAGMINLVEGKYCVSDNTLIIQFNQNMDILFFYYQLSNYKLNTLVFGSGQPLITGSQLKDLTIFLPHLSEQQAIAKILSDMDTEIESLEQKRNKYKAIKQGMMQELLTGKTRLV